MTRAVVGLLVALLSPAGAFAGNVPYLTGRVVDDAQILSPNAQTRLTAALKAHEQATSNQIVVLTVPTIQPESIEEYAVGVFNNWKLGQQGQNNGVLVVVVPQDRRMRIEVGYGLEPILTDAMAGAIIRDIMTPAFKRADYDAGVQDGVAAIIARLEGKSVATAAPAAARQPARSRSGFHRADMPWPQRILFSLFVFTIIGLFTFIGIVTPGVGWFLYVFLIPFWSMFPMMLIGPTPTLVLVAAYLIGYPVAKLRLAHTAWYRKAAIDLKTKGTATLGGFAVVSSGGGGFSSGGGFSGGGGSSGGGGASGSW
ncbi:MAG: hypothetical protein DMD85_01305 [Candidatus Rokuibacteriota bacterium]|nr:MAG: hypothetical protein DMD85_01305 [Candidatus Rokubacteria bacterium]